MVALVRAGTTFINGKFVERPGEETQPRSCLKEILIHRS